MSKCSSAFVPAWAQLASVNPTVFLFCSFEANAEEAERGMGKVSIVFPFIWLFIHPDCNWNKKKKKKILPLRTPEAFRVRKKAAFAFNCFPFTLKEQRVVQ